MRNDALFKSMLDKADAYPFFFGGDDESFFWRVAVIEDELFAERTYFTGSDTERAYYYCQDNDENAKRNIYNDIIIDFVVYHQDAWLSANTEGIFEDAASSEDEGLFEILTCFNKKYANFQNDVMYWFGIVVRTTPDNCGRYEITSSSELSEDERLVKIVLNRLSVADPITIVSADASFIWDIVNAHGEVWFYKNTNYIHDEYTYVAEEYGHISQEDEDAMDALRDAIRSCFYIDGWVLLGAKEDDLKSQLETIDLSLEELAS